MTKLQHVPVPSVGGGEWVALWKIPLFSIHYYSNVKPNSGSVVVELGLWQYWYAKQSLSWVWDSSDTACLYFCMKDEARKSPSLNVKNAVLETCKSIEAAWIWYVEDDQKEDVNSGKHIQPRGKQQDIIRKNYINYVHGKKKIVCGKCTWCCCMRFVTQTKPRSMWIKIS